MVKHLKFFMSLLLVAVTMGFLASCGEKDNANDNDTNANNTVETVQLSDTEWDWHNPDSNATGMLDVTVEFNGPALASVITTDFSTGILDTDCYMGTYTCSGNSGTLALRDDDTNTDFSATFTVNGTTMTLQFKGATYTLTKRQ